VEQISGQEVNDQGHYERKLKKRFLRIIFVKSGSIYIEPTPK